MAAARTDQTLVGGLFTLDLEGSLRRRCGRLAVHGLVFTLVAFFVLRALKLQYAGLISVFLLAASLRDHLVTLLDENRSLIWREEVPATVVNRRTSLSVLALFLGSFAGYLVIAQWFVAEPLEASFGAVVDVGSISPDGSLLQEGHFSSLPNILAHNLSVMVGIFAIATVYRAYGAMLVLSWNAAVWATVLTVLGSRAVDAGSLSDSTVFAGAVVGVLPHLTAEALGFCIAAIGGIFGSVGMSKYGSTDSRLAQVMMAVGMLLLVAFALLVVAAALEAWFAPWVFGLLSGR